MEVVRGLTSDDLPALLASGEAGGTRPQALKAIRHQHHQLARLLSKGNVSQVEASLITGYSQSYISTVRHDPAFEELLAYYASQREQIFVDTLERMRALGLSTLDELQARLAEEPEGWSKRELLEMAELMLVKPMVATRGALTEGVRAGGGGVSVSVNFVAAQPKDAVDAVQAAEDLDYVEVWDGPK